MSRFLDWLKHEWELLERRENEKYSTRRLSMMAGLSPNTLYQLLNHPEVRPSPETCHRLAELFDADPLYILELAGHVSTMETSDLPEGLAVAWQRPELQRLIPELQNLTSAELQLVQQLVNQLHSKRRDEERREAARGAAVALVVDDTADARSVYVNMLHTAGLKVLEATDGQHAVELIETSGAVIDIVLMDYRMPRMDGVEASTEIRKHFPDLPILFISAWDEPEMKEAAFEAGAAEYLVAPVGYEELMEAVTRVRRGESVATI